MSTWYKREPAAFIGGVVGLGPEAIGAYAVILDLLYQHDGAIANDARWVGGILGCSSRKAESLIALLIERGKLSIEGGNLTNSKASQVIFERGNGVKQSRNDRETPAKPPRDNDETPANQSRDADENDTETNENNELESDKSALDKKEREEKKEKERAFQAEFSEWYSAYPLHKARDAAEKSYRAARKRAEADVLLLAARRYAEITRATDKKFLAHPATWLNQARWEDEDLRPPKHNATLPVVLRGTPQWEAWKAYRESRGHRVTLDKLTVETEWPPGYQRPVENVSIVKHSSGEAA